MSVIALRRLRWPTTLLDLLLVGMVISLISGLATVYGLVVLADTLTAELIRRRRLTLA